MLTFATPHVVDTAIGAVPVTEVTPIADTVDHLPSPRKYVVLDGVPVALIPPTGKPVQLVNVPLEGVPNAPPVEYLLLNVFQSVDDKYPLVDVVD